MGSHNRNWHAVFMAGLDPRHFPPVQSRYPREGQAAVATPFDVAGGNEKQDGIVLADVDSNALQSVYPLGLANLRAGVAEEQPQWL